MLKKSSILHIATYLVLLLSVVGIPLVMSITLIQVNTTSSQTMTNKTLTSPIINGTGIVLEGATANDFETTIAAEDPTADRTHTVPDVTSDTFALLAATQTLTGKTLTSATLTSPTITGTPTISGVLQGATPLIFEGATANDFETTFAITDPTADRTFTFPDVTSDTVVFLTATQTLSSKTLTSPSITGTTTTTGAITQSADVDITSTEGSNFTASDACASGYTRVGLWCMDVNGSLTDLRTGVSATEGSYVSTVVQASAKLVLVKAYGSLQQDGTGETASVVNCVIPGDSSTTTCNTTSGEHQAVAISAAYLANEFAEDIGSVVVQAGATGNIKTRCVVPAGTGLTIVCRWGIIGYMD